MNEDVKYPPPRIYYVVGNGARGSARRVRKEMNACANGYGMRMPARFADMAPAEMEYGGAWSWKKFKRTFTRGVAVAAGVGAVVGVAASISIIVALGAPISLPVIAAAVATTAIYSGATVIESLPAITLAATWDASN